MADGSIDINAKPTEEISVRDVFGIDTDMKIKGFADSSDRVPDIDSTYKALRYLRDGRLPEPELPTFVSTQ